jgi:hypothetical protein
MRHTAEHMYPNKMEIPFETINFENFDRHTNKTVHYAMLLLKCMNEKLFGVFSVLWPTPDKYVTGEMIHVCLNNYNAIIWQMLK